MSWLFRGPVRAQSSTRVPTPAPWTTSSSKLKDVQDFLAGTTDTISRFVSTIRTRGRTVEGTQEGQIPGQAVEAQAKEKTQKVGDLTAIAVTVGIFVLVFMAAKRLLR